MEKAKVSAGYAVRDPATYIDFPFVKPVLPSKDDIFTTCGGLVYTFNNPDADVFSVEIDAASDNSVAM